MLLLFALALKPHGAELDVEDNSSRTPLYMAANKDSQQIVSTLLELSVDIIAVDKFGLTALHSAIH